MVGVLNHEHDEHNKLAEILRSIPGMTNVDGQNDEALGHSDVHFTYKTPYFQGTFSFEPGEHIGRLVIESWSAPEDMPEIIKAHIARKFPSAIYSKNGGTKFYWNGIPNSSI